MLILIRKIHERPLIDDIRISVLSIRGEQDRLGIDAPERVKVIREELMPPVDRPPDEAEEVSFFCVLTFSAPSLLDPRHSWPHRALRCPRVADVFDYF